MADSEKKDGMEIDQEGSSVGASGGNVNGDDDADNENGSSGTKRGGALSKADLSPPSPSSSSSSASTASMSKLSKEEEMKQKFHARFQMLCAQGLDPNIAAARALQDLQSADAGNVENNNKKEKEEEKERMEISTPSEPQVVKSTPDAMEISEQKSTEAPAVAHSVGVIESDRNENPSKVPSAAPTVPLSDPQAHEASKLNNTTAATKSTTATTSTTTTTTTTSSSTSPTTPPISIEEMNKLHKDALENNTFTLIIRKLGSVFCDPTKMIESFYDENENNFKLEEASGIFEIIQTIDEPPGVQASLQNALLRLSSSINYPFVQSLRKRLVPFLVAIEYEPFQYDPDLVKTLSGFFKSISVLPSDGKQVLVDFWKTKDPEYLQKVLDLTQMFLTLRASMGTAIANYKYLQEGVVILDLLFQVNKTVHFAEYEDFNNSGINEMATEYDGFLERDLKEYFHAHETAEENGTTALPNSFCDYPYLLDAGSKARVLQLEAREQQIRHAEDVLRQEIRAGGIVRRSDAYFVVVVRREELVNDVLDLIVQSSEQDYKKPLKVKFQGEEGVDEGGVQKEFFLLMVRKLLDPQFGMFTVDDDSRKLWFNANSFEASIKFELVGIVLGLAIYNGVILDLNFPLALYKKLLGAKPTLEDVKDYNPQLGKSLETMLTFDGDVESTFCQTFAVSYESFGEMKTENLKENGSDIPVTKENRHEYVDLYIDYIFSKSIEKFYKPFHKGFHMVCGGTFLNMFRPIEMELLLCGSPNLDFDALERTCRYEGFTEQSDTVKFFWRVVKGLSDEQKQKFLMFCTGSDRVPIRGLSELRLTISKNGDDSDRLPTASTCFNHLLLPEYTTFEKLKDRLLSALEHSEGFGQL